MRSELIFPTVLIALDLGVPIDAGAIADQIEIAFAQLDEKWRQRVNDVLAVADQFKGALDHVLNGLLFAQQKKGAADGH